MKKLCKTCRYAIWQRSDKGHVLYSRAGRCGYIIPKVKLPSGISFSDKNENCECWEGISKKKKEGER